jgi:hypothetical protein
MTRATASHKASPVLAIAGWLLFGPRPRIDARTIALAFVWPVAWIVYTLARGALVGWYPYPFLNATALGYPKVFANIALVIGLALGLAGAMHWLDSKLAPTRARDPPRH